MNPEFELILSTESRVLSTNIKTFEQQAEQYLATLIQTFETDDDFATAKEEAKTLKELEERTRNAIDSVLNGNKEVAELIETAQAIAEKFRQARLSREKLVKTKEAEIKQHITEVALDEITNTRDQLAKPSDISLALEIVLPKAKIVQRLTEVHKNKRTIDSLTKAINAEKALIISEMTTEVVRLKTRLDQLTAKSIWLFPDAVKLIASDEALAPIIEERIQAEQQREAELKAKAAKEAKEKADAEKVQAEARAIADEMAQQGGSSTENVAKENSTTPLENFIITLRLNEVTQDDAVAIARSLKERFEHVSLNKAK